MKSVAASEFKTHCLSILDDVAEHGTSFLVLKRGVPVARLLPVADVAPKQASLVGLAELVDPFEPALSADAWEAQR
jgi:antitoxin (DNA-binding transcriptional repressor) of toxin-antitoxin stability system